MQIRTSQMLNYLDDDSVVEICADMIDCGHLIDGYLMSSLLDRTCFTDNYTVRADTVIETNFGKQYFYAIERK